MLSKQQFTQEVDKAIEAHSMLSHPFYQAWNEGRLSLDILRDYARQYFAQVKAFPTYVSGVHSQSDDLALRRELLENLIEEEQGSDNHPELWLRFADALGASRDSVENAELLTQTAESVAGLTDLTQRQGVIAGLAALYAYESQIPAVAKTKREGLKEFYNIDSAAGVQFFSVHETADVWHQKVERDALEKLCDTEEKQKLAISSASKGAQQLWHFLDGVMEAHADKIHACEA